jgi:GntR family transcriptional regulator, transcriptional repressor for pyruvate dehydrogenase complex
MVNYITTYPIGYHLTASIVPLTQDLDDGLVGRVVRAVKERIQADRLHIGDALPAEAALAAELVVSRTVVREAFRALATLGIIQLVNGRRARVGAIDADVLGLVLDHAVHTDQASIQQIYDVRRTIEVRTVTLAALRRSEAEADNIKALATAMREAFNRPAEVMEHDIAFHAAIANASRNPLFALIVGSFHVVTRQTWRIGWESRPTDAERLANVECHERIAAAIAAREPRVAEALMAEHFDQSVKALLSAGVI